MDDFFYFSYTACALALFRIIHYDLCYINISKIVYYVGWEDIVLFRWQQLFVQKVSENFNKCVENNALLLACLDSKFFRADVILCVGANNERSPIGASVYFHKANKQQQPESFLTNIYLVWSSFTLKQSCMALSSAQFKGPRGLFLPAVDSILILCILLRGYCISMVLFLCKTKEILTSGISKSQPFSFPKRT